MTPIAKDCSAFSRNSVRAPDLRMGQLVANLATLARGAEVEAIWDAEDDELASAAQRLLRHYTQPADNVA